MKGITRHLKSDDYKQRKPGLRVIISGGGTGGHLFPGIAIGKELKKRYSDSTVLFITGRRRIEGEIVSRAGFEAKSIDIEGLMGKDISRMALSLLRLMKGSIQSLAIINYFKPQLVVGFGGYTSGPVCLMAWIMGIPTAVHEQNSFPGITNRLLAHFVQRVFISFAETGRYLKKDKCLLTGNPIRDDILALGPQKREGKRDFVVLVMGGSQGAKAINRATLSAIKELRKEGLIPFIIHQTGREDFKRVADEYNLLGHKAEVTAFIEDMALAYRRADLVICRAGATTIAELTALGKASILIPYPYAINKHQDANARHLVNTGGAVMVLEEELEGKSLSKKVRMYMENREELKKMSFIALNSGRPQACKVIVEQLMELINTTKISKVINGKAKKKEQLTTGSGLQRQ